MSVGEAFSWCYSSLLPFLDSGLEPVPFNPPHVGPCGFLGGLKRGYCMQKTGSRFQSGWGCCVSVQGVPHIRLLFSPLILGDSGVSDVCVCVWGVIAGQCIEAWDWYCL